jgi:hypothetical protein
MQTVFKSYKKDFEHSYSFGAFPTIELIKSKPEKVIKVFASTSYREEGREELENLCRKNNVELEINDKVISPFKPKGELPCHRGFQKV